MTNSDQVFSLKLIVFLLIILINMCNRKVSSICTTMDLHIKTIKVNLIAIITSQTEKHILSTILLLSKAKCWKIIYSWIKNNQFLNTNLNKKINMMANQSICRNKILSNYIKIIIFKSTNYKKIKFWVSGNS